MTTTKWLSTAAVALVFSTGAAMAQPAPDVSQKREQSPRAQAPSKDESPAAGEQRQKDRTAQQPASRDSAKESKETQRSDDKSAQPRQQAKEPAQKGDAKQQAKEAQDPSRDQRRPTDAAQQRESDQKAREAKQPTEQKQQQSGDQQKRDSRTTGSQPPAAAKEQQTQTQQPTQNNQASQPSRQENTAQTPQPQTAQNQASAPSPTGTASASVSTEQRTQIIQGLAKNRAAISRETQNLNIQVNIGTQLPPRVRPRPLPPDIVRIVPRYRGYEYTVVEDEIVIVEPRSRRVVEVINESGRGSGMAARAGSQRMVITDEQRETLRQSVRRIATTGSTSQAGTLDANCLTLQSVPEELTRANPELGNYKMLAIGEQVVLIDPREQKVVEVVD